MAEEGASSRCRWLFGNTERQTGSLPPHSVSLSNSHDAMEQDETARDEGGKVARNASATVRSPVPDEQIWEYGR